MVCISSVELVQNDTLVLLQDEAASLKYPYVKSFLKHVRKQQVAKQPISASTTARFSS